MFKNDPHIICEMTIALEKCQYLMYWEMGNVSEYSWEYYQ